MNCPKCGAEVQPGAKVCRRCGAEIPVPGAGASLARRPPAGGDAVLAELQRQLAAVYTVEQMLGHGGMGVVYRATEIKPPRAVAITLLPPRLGLGPANAAFKDAAKIAMSLNHPHIVPIYRVGLKAGVPYFIAAKLVNGLPLDVIIRAQGALPLPAVVAVLRDAAEALDFAHGRGALHGDLTSADMLVDATGRVSVAGFGIARVIRDAAMAVTGGDVGTDGGASARATPPGDKYSLGVVALQMLTGSLAHAALVRDVGSVRDGLPDALLRVVRRALAAEPAERFASTSDMLDAIRTIPFSDVDRREAFGILGQLARGEAVPRVRLVPPVAKPAQSAPSATAVRPQVAPPQPKAPSSAPSPRPQAAPQQPKVTPAPAPRPQAAPPAPKPPAPPEHTEPVTPGPHAPAPKTVTRAAAIRAAEAPTASAPTAATPAPSAPRATSTTPPPPAPRAPASRDALPPTRVEPAVQPPAELAQPAPGKDSADRALEALLKAPADGLVIEEPLARISRELTKPSLAKPEPAAPAPPSSPLPPTREEPAFQMRRPRRFSLDGLPSVSGRPSGEKKAVRDGARPSGERKAALEPARTSGEARAVRDAARHSGERRWSGDHEADDQSEAGLSWTARVARAAVALVVLSGVGVGAYYLMFRNPATRPLARSGVPSQAQPGATAPSSAAADTVRPLAARQPSPAVNGAGGAGTGAAGSARSEAGTDATGLLLLTSVPATAEILVDGRPSGSGGFLDSEVTAGRRRVQVSAPGFAALDTIVTVRDGATVDLGQITLARSGAGGPAPSRAQAAPGEAPAIGALPTPPTPTPAAGGAAGSTGWVRVRAVPSTATIFIDGQRAGTGVLVDYEAAAGQRRLRIVNPGYLTFDTTVTVEEFQTLRLGQITLTRAGGGP